MGTDPKPTRARWCKSSYSADAGGDCVEVAVDSATVAIRDSKRTGCGGLTVGTTAFAAFLRAARGGELPG
ncbi:DUF397 domain-containing protein [Streptomyces sp. NPDC057638]|uniref:DUF397 domain-containing protein n=1 Tax=Streptomyces sp. NPDC057638 TaxID=3346190 RepID=UPI0036A038F5